MWLGAKMGTRATHLVMAGAIVLGGCATGGGETPRRPSLAVTDEVGAVARALVVGTWQCRELNPYHEIPQQTITTTYNADGTFMSQSRSAPRPPLGAMLVKVTGRWAVEGDRITTSEVETEAGSADGDAWTNMMANVGATFVNSFGGTQSNGAGDVLKLGRGELVFRPMGIEDPPVISCTR